MRHTKPNKRTALLSIKVPQAVSARVARLAKEKNTTLSAVVRDALEQYEPSQPGPSFAEAAAAWLGVFRGPGDLSTAKKHLEGFGED